MQSSTLTAPSRYSFTDALQVFKGYSLVECLRGCHYAFRDYMVEVFGETMLFLTALTQQALCALRTLGLQPGAKPSVSVTQAVDLCAGVNIAFAIGGNIYDTHVHAQPALRLASRGFFDRDGSIQEELPVSVKKVAFPLLVS